MLILRAVLYGILEGVTEWLPISSTGHLILLEQVLHLPMSPTATALFEVVIQLGAMLAVLVCFWQKLVPFGGQRSPRERRFVYGLWGRVLLAALPSAAMGLWLDDWLTAYCYRPPVVAVTLILYGLLFIWLEKRRKPHPSTDLLPCEDRPLPLRTAFLIGCFQVLALVPGTSRSGATVLGGMLLGLSRPAAAEFSFFLGLPTMLGAGLLKGAKLLGEGNWLTAQELLLLLVGTLTAFLTSLAVIRFLMNFVRRRSYVGFGVYRILLGAAVVATILCG